MPQTARKERSNQDAETQMLQGAFAEFARIDSQHRKGRKMPDMSSQSLATMISDHEML